MSVDILRSSYSLSPRVTLKLAALAERAGLPPTRWLEMLIEREAFRADITVTNADVVRYHDDLTREDT